MGRRVCRRDQRPERSRPACSRAFRHGILGGVAGVLAGPAVPDAARPALRRLTAPKSNPPRAWTPQGHRRHGRRGLGDLSGGALPACYKVIFARVPIPIWDTERRFPEFEALDLPGFKPGDRIKFVPCSSRSSRRPRRRSRPAPSGTMSSAIRSSRCASTTTGWPPSTPASGSRRANP